MRIEKGYLTYDEVNDMLPLDINSLDQPNNVMMIGGMDIDIVDTILKVRIPEEVEIREEEEKEVDFDLKRNEYPTSKTYDPVRVYFKEMGSIPLLSQEGEIQIAKRIEKGLKKVTDVLLQSPVTVKNVIQLGEKLQEGKIKAREVTKTLKDDNFNLVEDIHLKRICELIDQVRELDKQTRSLKKEGRRLNKEDFNKIKFNS